MSAEHPPRFLQLPYDVNALHHQDSESSAQQILRSIRWIGSVRESVFSSSGINSLQQLYELGECWKDAPNLEAVERLLDSNYENLWRTKIGSSNLLKILYSAKCIVESKLAMLEQLRLPSASTEFYVDLEYGEFPFCIGVKVITHGKASMFQRFAESKAESDRAIEEFNQLRENASDYVAYTWSGQDSKLLGLEANNVDLYRLVNQSMMLPMKSFNVKDVASYFGHHRPDLSITDGLVCLLAFEQYLGATDPETRRGLTLDIKKYNWNDVESLYSIAEAIKTV